MDYAGKGKERLVKATRHMNGNKAGQVSFTLADDERAELVVQPGRGDRPTFVNLMCCTQVVDIEALIEGVVDYFGERA